MLAFFILLSTPSALAAPSFNVSSLDENGYGFTAPATGTYRFSITGGCYENCPQSARPDRPELWGWKTRLLIYKNRPIERYVNESFTIPSNWDYALGDNMPVLNVSQAEQRGKGMFIDILLNQGDHLTFICDDSAGAYVDNSGTISVDATLIYTVTLGKTTTFTYPNYFYAETYDDPNNRLPYPDDRIASQNGSQAVLSMACPPGHACGMTELVGITFNWDTVGLPPPMVADIPVTVTVDMDYDMNADYVIGQGSANSGMSIVNLLAPNHSTYTNYTPGVYYVDYVGYEARNSGRRTGHIVRTFNTTADGRPLTVGTLGNSVIVRSTIQAHVGNNIVSSHYSSANVRINSITIESQRPVMLSNIAAPVAAVSTGAGISILGILLDKLLNSVFAASRSYAQRWTIVKEANILGIMANSVKKPVLFNISLLEIIVAVFSILLLGIAFLYVDKELPFIIINLAIFVLIAGVTWLIHELAHYFSAYRYGNKIELRFWGIGTFALIVTTILFGVVFGQPARTMINDSDKLGKKRLGLVSLAGPAISLLISILLALTILFGGSYAIFGKYGLPISMVASVYSLIPIDPMEGKKVWDWNKLVWLIVFVPALAAYLVILILYSMNLI